MSNVTYYYVDYQNDPITQQLVSLFTYNYLIHPIIFNKAHKVALLHTPIGEFPLKQLNWNRLNEFITEVEELNESSFMQDTWQLLQNISFSGHTSCDLVIVASLDQDCEWEKYHNKFETIMKQIKKVNITVIDTADDTNLTVRNFNIAAWTKYGKVITLNEGIQSLTKWGLQVSKYKKPVDVYGYRMDIFELFDFAVGVYPFTKKNMLGDYIVTKTVSTNFEPISYKYKYEINGGDDDNNNNDDDDELIPAAEGLLRLREDDHHHIDHNEESLHSFRFSSFNTLSIKEELLQKKKRLHGTLPGHYATSDLVKENRTKTKTVGSPVSSKNHFRRPTNLPPLVESSSPPPPTKSISSCSSRQSTNTNVSTKYTNTPPTTEDEEDEEEYEEEYEEEEDTYIPHLHNRLKQQNQAILTTYDDWRIILTNSIAQDVLVSHLHHKMNEEQKLILVGKSVMDLIEPSYQNRLKSIIVKRRNELKRRDAENHGSGGGMVLVCGNVVKYRRCLYTAPKN